MDRSRFVITDYQWEKMESHCLGRKRDPGRTGSDPRMFLEAVFGLRARDRRGGTFRPILATGTPFIAAL